MIRLVSNIYYLVVLNDMAIQRVPPNNEDAEQAVLGALLIDHEAINNISQLTKSDFFYNENNRVIFEAMLTLYEERKPIDLLTLTHALKKKKLFDRVGGSSYLTSLASVVPTAANIEHYAQIIKETYIRRALIKMAASMTDISFSEDKASEEILDTVEQKIFSLSQENIKQGFIHIRDALAESFDKLDELHKKQSQYRGIETGFIDLDVLLSGLQESNLIVLAELI